MLRTEVARWKDTPYADNGTSKSGIGNTAFARAILEAALGLPIPASYDDELHTGKLVNRENLEPGDLLFFEGGGFGPFKSRWVGVFVGRNEVALARKDFGVGIVSLEDSRLTSSYKTARRVSGAANAAAPTFDLAKFGSDRAALLREIAKAWSGTLYRQNGTSFSGIGNEEFVRAVYEAIYETELEGRARDWATMGEPVDRNSLEAGDVILYDSSGVFSSQKQAGLYIGDGEFVHSLKGSAVTISKLSDERWQKAFRAARRIDPDALTRAEEARAAEAASGEPAHPGKNARSSRNAKPPKTAAARGGSARPASPHVLTDEERKLRDATEQWRGTPYKIGGTSKSGIDCSAFVRAIYDDVYKVELPRTAEEQEQLGLKVDRRQLQTGDLVFFRTQGMGPFFKSRHVGLYLGGGEFAQASGRHGVTISSLDDYYWNKKYEGARRLGKTSTAD